MKGIDDHLADEALFDAADPSSREDVRAHLAQCASCRTRAGRLRAGRSLIELAREEPPAIAWQGIDARVMAAAEEAAAGIRAHRVAAPRRMATAAYVSVALAAAAAGLVLLRMPSRGHESDGARVATSTRPARTALRAMDPEATRQVDGVVLMLAAPVSYRAAGAADTAALTGETHVRAGDRLGAGERGGRAVVGLRAGFRLDARSGASVRVASLSRAETTVALDQGEARLDGPVPASGERVTMETGGWTVAVKGGAFVAKVEHDVVRLRVVAGKVDVSRGAGAPVREVRAGDEIELSQSDDGMRLVGHDARDDEALDASMFAEGGQGFELPRLPDRASIAIAGHGSLPTDVAFVRVSARTEIEATSAGDTWSLSVDPAHLAPTSWRHAARVAVATPRNPGAAGTMPDDPDAIVPSTPHVPPVRPAPAGATASERGRWVAAETLRVSIADCGVRDGARMTIAFDPNEDGSVTSPRVSGLAVAPAVRACVERHALTLRLAHEAIPSPLRTVQFELTTP